jgi:hypothetical protein
VREGNVLAEDIVRDHILVEGQIYLLMVSNGDYVCTEKWHKGLGKVKQVVALEWFVGRSPHDGGSARLSREGS